MTRMNKLSMTNEQMTINERKYKGAISVPQVFIGMQLSLVFIVSNMITFQSSPVAILSKIIIP
jgi:glutaredoxin